MTLTIRMNQVGVNSEHKSAEFREATDSLLQVSFSIKTTLPR